MQRIVFTDDLASDLATVLGELSAARVLVLTGRSHRFVDQVEEALGGRDVAVFDGAKVHVPSEVVESARARARAIDADTLVSIGGGSATGLGKALRLDYEASFVAIPTTYSGSERTTVFGMTEGARKRTGRDPRVRPDVVLYAPALAVGLPEKLTTQSLLNALAHPISALGAGVDDASLERRALDTIGRVTDAASRLVADPESLEARRLAFEATSLAGEIIEEGTLGVHHEIAHFLGGRFGLPHAALHSVLLVHTARALSESQPAVFAAIAEAAGRRDLPDALLGLLKRVGAETSLAALGVERDALERALSERPELPRAVVLSAFDGI